MTRADGPRFATTVVQVHHPHRYPRRMNRIHAFAAAVAIVSLASTLAAHPPLADGHEHHEVTWHAIE